MKIKCKDCTKLYTCDCPIRVWGRNERQKGKHLHVNPDKDYCSRFKNKIIVKKYKSVLALVWNISNSLWFKLRFTWMILIKRLKGE